MGGTPPAGTAATLFARKGEAAPLGDSEPKSRNAAGGRGVPQTDLFGYIVDPDGPGTSAESGADGEPPPAASLLSILTQTSAAVLPEVPRRPALEAPPDGMAAAGPGAVAAIVPDPDAAAAAPHADPPVAQPVPLPATGIPNLPALIAPPHADGKNRAARAAPAAALFAAAAGLAALYFGGAPAAPERGDGGIFAAGRPAIGDATNPPTGDAIPRAEAARAAEIASAEPAATPKAEIGDVRIDNAGRAVVSGTAAPGETLIVLRNARPLGTVRADTEGAWTFVATGPMRAGRHEISVVPFQAETSVVVERPDAATARRARPAAGSRYFVQLASLPSSADARREAAKLKQRISGLVPPERLGIRDATIVDGRTVFRVAIGGFPDRQTADALCERIRRQAESCLVMRGR